MPVPRVKRGPGPTRVPEPDEAMLRRLRQAVIDGVPAGRLRERFRGVSKDLIAELRLEAKKRTV